MQPPVGSGGFEDDTMAFNLDEFFTGTAGTAAVLPGDIECLETTGLTSV